MRISGNTIFIPGATSGIGLGLALRLHEAGNRVIVGGRRTELLSQIADAHPGIETVRIDTADADDVVRVSAEVQRRFPDTNVLIAMAGIMRSEDLRDNDFLSTAVAEVETNILGPLRLVAAFTEFLAAQPDATIITVSSGLAFTPMVGTPTYSATKAAIHSFTDSLRIQLADSGIGVLELVPPAVQTDLMPGQAEAEWAMPLDDFLDEVMHLLPEATREILVERVKPLRFAELNGNRDDLMAALAHV
ncbi:MULTISPECIES: SDR family oxidoreductase [unclassified Gordonia (in: high G+C Gram-positive bacteria)]|uniref:SDR family oxidoreductase n=1 Tax=unclassified Gordonia (in: high G+C Gram-positive bacteria) TaxID=2657482 RepID=UPI001F0F87D6|nr:SDR family NAD(P)-dependent oxidoreductase [Gordonia sp. ABSL49_1]MCH5643307.1 SDR family NAD(P)-dependent oxidoreductase [Gordonia sp. ABSL49_1]